jgi:hypothetical protein
MNQRARLVLAGIVTVLLLGGATTYGIVEFGAYRARQGAASQLQSETSAVRASLPVPRLVFRDTTVGADYGYVASVPLARPGSARTERGVVCDRVYETTTRTMCLRTSAGVTTTFSASLLDENGTVLRTWPLPGIPSRTRISPDSNLVAFTSFVTGEAYGTVGFSTSTRILSATGHDYGNLESFALSVDGQAVTSSDRNFWGVTFSSNDNVFYATAAADNHTWLVEGDLTARTLTAIRENAECPSLSPDGQHIAYKKNVSTTATPYWTPAVLDLKTGEETVLPEKHNVDDQAEWLDDSTILYGLPRADQPGDSDVWSISVDGASAPRLYLEHAWSPSVVRK